MKDFYTFVKPGWISVWVGDFRSEDDFDDYLLDEFSRDFGFEIPQRAVREIGAEPELVEIARLVDGFSRSKTFDSEVVNAAKAHGISRASCMLIIYNFAYVPNSQLSAEPAIKFIGTLPFPGFAD